MKESNVSQAELVRRMKTSRAVVHRLLDANDLSVTHRPSCICVTHLRYEPDLSAQMYIRLPRTAVNGREKGIRLLKGAPWSDTYPDVGQDPDHHPTG